MKLLFILITAILVATMLLTGCCGISSSKYIELCAAIENFQPQTATAERHIKRASKRFKEGDWNAAEIELEIAKKTNK